jgi:DUF1009 family protein
MTTSSQFVASRRTAVLIRRAARRTAVRAAMIAEMARDLLDGRIDIPTIGP